MLSAPADAENNALLSRCRTAEGRSVVHGNIAVLSETLWFCVAEEVAVQKSMVEALRVMLKQVDQAGAAAD